MLIECSEDLQYRLLVVSTKRLVAVDVSVVVECRSTLATACYYYRRLASGDIVHLILKQINSFSFN